MASKLGTTETGATLKQKFNANADTQDLHENKLSSIATGATANDTDANLKNRANHTGTQAASTIVQSATARFVTDAEKTAWNGKVDPSAIPTAATLTQDATHRFVTDTEKTTWNGKANLGDIPAAETGATITAKLVAAATPLPLALLPDANLSATQFTKPGTDIEISLTWLDQAITNLGYSKGGSGTTNTTPAAPTAGVVDDTANTFGFTLTSGIALSGNYEYTLNGGTTVADVTVNPIVVGNVAKANGQVGVRVKAATGRNSSTWLYNASPFTVAATVSTNYLPGFTAINLAGNAHTNSYTDNGDGTISAPQDNSSVIVTAYSIADQGELAVKVTGNSNEDSTIGVTYNGNLYDPTGINVVAGVLYAVSGGGQYIFSVQPAIGDWVIMRFYDNANASQRLFRVFKTSDGTNYTELVLPNDMQFNYIQEPSRFVTMSIGGGAGIYKIYYPQAKGLVLR